MSTSWRDNFVDTFEWKFCFKKLFIYLYFFRKFENWFGQVVHQVNAWRISQNVNNKVLNFRPRAPRLFVCPWVFYLDDHI